MQDTVFEVRRGLALIMVFFFPVLGLLWMNHVTGGWFLSSFYLCRESLGWMILAATTSVLSVVAVVGLLRLDRPVPSICDTTTLHARFRKRRVDPGTDRRAS